MHTNFLKVALFAAFVGAIFPAFSQINDSKTNLDKGIDLFSHGQYQASYDIFSRLSQAPGTFQSEANYWNILALIALGNNGMASTQINRFLEQWPRDYRVPDLQYQRGRILYATGDYESALRVFSVYLDTALGRELYSSAIYWIAECLYSMGRLDEADRVYLTVIRNFPNSVKVEAAQYKRALISTEFKQQELLKLIAWSNEELLRSSSALNRRASITYAPAPGIPFPEIASSAPLGGPLPSAVLAPSVDTTLDAALDQPGDGGLSLPRKNLEEALATKSEAARLLEEYLKAQRGFTQ